MLQRIFSKLKSLTQNKEDLRHELVGPMKLWKMKRDFQFVFLTEQGLNPKDKFLDLGCGTLRGGIPIINLLDAGNYTGLDIREKVLQEARKELAVHNLDSKLPNLIHFSNFDDLHIRNQFDVIFAFSVLIHMNDEIVSKCFQFVANSLTTNGSFFANINLPSITSGSWQGFPVMFKEMDFYEDLAGQNNLRIKILGTLRSLGHISGDELQDKQMMLKISHKK